MNMSQMREDYIKQCGHEPTFEILAQFHAIEFTQSVLSNVPELRSVAIVFDWWGGINKGAMNSVWYNRQGVAGTADRDELLGGLEQTVKLLRHQTKAALELIDNIGKAVANQQTILNQLELQTNVQKQGLKEQLERAGSIRSSIPNVGGIDWEKEQRLMHEENQLREKLNLEHAERLEQERQAGSGQGSVGDPQSAGD